MTTLEAINHITSEKKRKNIFPTHALISEISNITGKSKSIIISEVKGLGLNIGRTINDEYVKQ